MMKKRYYTVLVSTILVFVALFAVVGILIGHGITYNPSDGSNRVQKPHETDVHYDEDNNPIIFKPAEGENYNFLVLGHDRAALLTDVAMLINYNVTEGSVSIVQFPRDTYVSYGVPTSRINASYSTFLGEARRNGSDKPEIDALHKFADILEEALCTRINFCAVMDLNGFRNIVDAIGGVEMNVPERLQYNDPEQNLYIDLYPGYQTLNGAQAEQFVRYRIGYINADLGRQDAQKIFMSAFIEKVKKSIDIGTLTDLAGTVLDNLHTDITVSDFVYFGKNILNIDMSKVTMSTVPINAGPSGHVVIVKKEMVKLINEHFNLYDSDITEVIFDKKKAFVYDGNAGYENAYYADKAVYGGKEYAADDVNKDSIYIP